MKEGKIVFVINNELKNKLKEKLEGTTNSTVSDIMRGCVLHILDQSIEDLRQFIFKNIKLEYKYLDAKAK